MDAQIAVDSARNHDFTARGWDNLPDDLDQAAGTYSRSVRHMFTSWMILVTKVPAGLQTDPVYSTYPVDANATPDFMSE